MIKRLGYGLALWAVTYAVAIPLLPVQKADPIAFKAIVMSIALVVSSVVIVLYFKTVMKDYFSESIKVAVTWTLLNWILDIVALLPFTHQSLPTYFFQIGIEYAAGAAPILAVGYLLQHKSSK